MKKYDASIVLNLHREGPFLKRTLISLDQAVKLARDEGHSIELVAVLDRADELTRKVMQEYDCSTYSASKIIEVDNGSLGLSRNDGIEASDGEYIYTADGDDLISENYFIDFMNFYKENKLECAYFPEYVFAFGDDYFYTHYNDLEIVTPYSFINMHPFISRICAHNSIFDLVKYQDTKLKEGYAYEDWLFNCDIVANNINIKIVPNTALFYRQRSGSLLRQSNSISTKQIPPSELFNPETYVKISENYKSRTHYKLDRIKENTNSFNKNMIEFIEKANLIESEIRVDLYKNSIQYDSSQYSKHVGKAYFDIAKLIGKQKFDEVFLFPFISKGGAEKYLLEVVHHISATYPERNVLILLGEGEKVVSNKVTLPNVTCIDLHVFSDFLSMDERLLITLKILQTCAKLSRIHYRQSIYSDEFLKKYSMLFKENEQIYYRFSDSLVINNNKTANGFSPLTLISNSLDVLNKVITDNESIIIKDKHRLGLTTEKWCFLPAPVKITTQENQKNYTYNSKNIIWASRLDREKRPQLLQLISNKINETGSKIDIYGSNVLDINFLELADSHARLNYKGSFNGLNSLNLQDYGIFLYTSYYDGLPNILLEAMAAGLLVIAPDVGGISEIVKHKQTGYLIKHTDNDDQMADRYAAAIKEIIAHPEQIEAMTKNATKLLHERHSYERYDQHIRELFGSNNSEAQKERERNNFDITNPETANALLIERLTRQRDIALYEAEAASKMLHANPKDFISYGMINNSKAFRLAELYTRTAHGPNFAVKFWRFGRALYPVAKRMAKRKLFNR